MKTRARAILSFSGILWAAALPIGGAAFAISGWPGTSAAVVAASVCWLAGLISIWLVSGLGAPDELMVRVLAGMLPRMGIPFLACFFAILRRSVLIETGFIYYTLIFYFITLAVETGLFFRHRPANDARTEIG